MTTSHTTPSVTRRTALAGLGAGGLGLALAASTRQVSALDAAADMANHPMVGAWLVAGPRGPSMTIVHPNGMWMDGGLAAGPGPNGTTFNSTTVGTWEPYGERGIHFTAVQLHSDANGNYVGSITVDGHPVASEDGQSLVDDSPESGPTIRDAQGNVLDVLRGGPPVTGVRMGVGAPGFPAATPAASTPTT